MTTVHAFEIARSPFPVPGRHMATRDLDSRSLHKKPRAEALP
ncbi:MAG: hypothetical protein Q6373_010415 [Candidatus Sigynarchaeota archaeon]